MNNNIIIDIIILFVFLIFFSLQIMGFYFTFLCLQYTNQNHDFMLKTNIVFRAEVCKQHASKVIIIRRETFFVTHLACSLCHLSCKLVARLLVSCRTIGN